MGKITRRKFTPEFKARVVLEALKEQSTLAELSKKYEVSGVMISRWKGEFIEHSSSVFVNSKKDEKANNQVDSDKLYEQIGKLKVENDFLKKSCEKLGI
jgi:transposase